MKKSEASTTELREKILKGLKLSFKKLVEEKRKTGESLVFSEGGKIIRIKATDINV